MDVRIQDKPGGACVSVQFPIVDSTFCYHLQAEARSYTDIMQDKNVLVLCQGLTCCGCQIRLLLRLRFLLGGSQGNRAEAKLCYIISALLTKPPIHPVYCSGQWHGVVRLSRTRCSQPGHCQALHVVKSL
ncbi:hypothetical protein FKM82_013195 [Ascaphus truei]